MNSTEKQDRLIAGLLGNLSQQTAQSVLHRFDDETQDRLMNLTDNVQSLQTHANRELLHSFAQFLNFNVGSSTEIDQTDKGLDQTQRDDVSGGSPEFVASARHGSREANRFGPRNLANAIQDELIAIEAVYTLDDQSLDTLLKSAPAELTVDVLCCSPQRFVRRVLARLAAPEAAQVQHEIQARNQVNVDELTRAQDRFRKFATQLLRAGMIQPPSMVD